MSIAEQIERTAVERYLDDAERFDGSKSAFQQLVREGLALTTLTLREVAMALETAPGTVSRWQNGHTAPAAFMRPRVVAFFKKRVRRLRS